MLKSADGRYIVQGRDRNSVEYLEGPKRAIIEVEHGPRYICIFATRMTGWFLNGDILPMTDEEKRVVIERVAAAERFHGLAVEIAPG